MVHHLHVVFPSTIGTRVTDRETFLSELLVSCPALARFETQNLGRRLKRQQFRDGMNEIRRTMKDPMDFALRVQEFKLWSREQPEESGPFSDEDRQRLRSACWRWEPSGSAPGDFLTGPYDVELAFFEKVILMYTNPEFRPEIEDFYPLHLELAQQVSGLVNAEQMLFVPQFLSADSYFQDRIELDDFDSLKSLAASVLGTRWDSLEQVRRGQYDFSGYYLT